MSLENPITSEIVAPGRIEQLGRKLKDLGLNAENVPKALGIESIHNLYPLEYRHLPLFVEKLAENETSLNHLVSLFILGLPGKKDVFEELLGPADLKLLCGSGFCSIDQNDIHVNFTLLPFEKLLIATDKVFLNVDKYGNDEYLSSDNLVWRLDKTSYILAKGLLRDRCEAALDLGCGSGLQSFLLAESVNQVTGVDINPRAVNLAEFNARLNGIKNVRFICGDMYQALNGQKFQRIVSNPPSAPGLVKAWNREGGISGRELVEEILSGARDHLEYGGICQTTLHLGYNEDKDIIFWLNKYLPEKDFKSFIIKHTDEREAAEYALQEAYQKSGPRDYGTFQRTYQIYRAGLKAAGIERIAFGLLSSKFKEESPALIIKTADLLNEPLEQNIRDYFEPS